MKKLLSFICVVLVFSACHTKTESNNKYPLSSYELGGFNMKDTINIIDGNKLKQGLWIMRNKDTMVYRNDTGYSTKGHTFGEVQRMLKSGDKGLFVSYDSLAVKSEQH